MLKNWIVNLNEIESRVAQSGNRKFVGDTEIENVG